MEAFAALPGGALLVLVSGIVENKYIKYMRIDLETVEGNVSVRDIGAGGVNSLHRSLPARADGQDVDTIIVSKVDVGDKLLRSTYRQGITTES